MNRIGFVVAAVMVGGILHAQQAKRPEKPLTEQELVQKIQEIDRLNAQADALKAQMDAIVAQRQFKCMSAIGNKVFCGCLSEELPVVTELPVYIAVASALKEEMEYSKMKPDDKKMVDAILAARDKCVAMAFPPR